MDFVLSHSLRSSIEPCGCGVNKEGGAAGRLDAVARIRAELGGDAIGVEGGDWLTGGDGPWDNVALDSMLDLFRRERTSVVCLGEGEVLQAMRLLRKGVPLVCANAGPRLRPGIGPSAVIGRVAITSIVDPALVVGTEGLLSAPNEALAVFEDDLRHSKRVGILFLHASDHLRRTVYERLSISRSAVVVVDAHHEYRNGLGVSRCGAGISVRSEPNGKQVISLSLSFPEDGGAEALENKSWSEALRDVPAGGGAASAAPPTARAGVIVYQAGLVSVRRGASPEAQAFLRSYLTSLDARVETQGRQYEGFTGAASCAACHAPEAARWATTPHAIAMKSLSQVGKAGRADCYACHVTGDMGRTGSEGLPPAAPKALHAVGCESCHGPGAAHVLAPRDAKMVLPGAGTCLRCHIPKFDPSFEFSHSLPMATCQPSSAPTGKVPYLGEGVQAAPAKHQPENRER